MRQLAELRGTGRGGDVRIRASCGADDEAADRGAQLHNVYRLMTHRRCACRPCVQILSCGCHEPLNKRICDTLHRYTCSRGDEASSSPSHRADASRDVTQACAKPEPSSQECGGAGSRRPASVLGHGARFTDRHIDRSNEPRAPSLTRPPPPYYSAACSDGEGWRRADCGVPRSSYNWSLAAAVEPRCVG